MNSKSSLKFIFILYVVHSISLNVYFSDTLTFVFRSNAINELTTCNSIYHHFSDIDFRWGMPLSEVNPLNIVCPGGDDLFGRYEKVRIPIFFFIYLSTLAALLLHSIKNDIKVLKSSERFFYKAKEILYYGRTPYLLIPFAGTSSIMLVSLFPFDWGSYGFFFGILSVPIAQVLALLSLLYKIDRDNRRKVDGSIQE